MTDTNGRHGNYRYTTLQPCRRCKRDIPRKDGEAPCDYKERMYCGSQCREEARRMKPVESPSNDVKTGQPKVKPELLKYFRTGDKAWVIYQQRNAGYFGGGGEDIIAVKWLGGDWLKLDESGLKFTKVTSAKEVGEFEKMQKHGNRKN